MGLPGRENYVEYRTPGSYSFTVPNQTTTVNITAAGGGGAGGNDSERENQRW